MLVESVIMLISNHNVHLFWLFTFVSMKSIKGNCGQLTTIVHNVLVNVVLWLNLISLFLDAKKSTQKNSQGYKFDTRCNCMKVHLWGDNLYSLQKLKKKWMISWKNVANIFYGCTYYHVRKVANEYAESLKLVHNFNDNCKMAERDWLEGFLKRNRISMRKPEATSVYRITAFNNREVSLFHNNLETLIETHHFTSKNIYNCDETGISTVHDPGKIFVTEKSRINH